MSNIGYGARGSRFAPWEPSHDRSGASPGQNQTTLLLQGLLVARGWSDRGAEIIRSEDDGEAMTVARGMTDGRSVEVWDRERFIGRLDHHIG